ncbi:hypothetical protein TIFTF001_021124 [Ficus carica]|uniref:Uncharacterized protein n=1 Tax=Ficus carica TaxID=3494 RepID=A0AA88AUN7_FICCA|nr:hypothetical protein TIFTF001_021124 [Ficus carica]
MDLPCCSARTRSVDHGSLLASFLVRIWLSWLWVSSEAVRGSVRQIRNEHPPDFFSDDAEIFLAISVIVGGSGSSSRAEEFPSGASSNPSTIES